MKILNRTNLNYKIREMCHFPVTFASAPSGFGKTTSLRTYFNGQDVHHVWLSMYEQYDELWAWEKIITALNQYLEDDKLPSFLPASRSAIDSFADILSTQLQQPLFIILDDVETHVIPKIMKTLSIYSYASVPFLHFVIITQDGMNDIMLNNFSNNTLILNTNDFAFTKDELFYLCRLEQILLPDEEIEQLYDYTNGWIAAILLVLESHKNHYNLHYRGDINTLIRGIFFDTLAPDIQGAFMKLSSLKHFTLPFALKICDSKRAVEKLIELERENHSIQTIGRQTYQFLPVFREFLSKQLLISSIDIDELTKKIGNSYLEQEEPLEAVEAFLKTRDFDSIIHVLNQYSELDFSDIAPDLMVRVFQKLPDTYKDTYPHIFLKWITDCITNFPQLDGPALLEDFKQRIDAGLIQGDKQQLYGEYYFIHAFIHFNDVRMMMDDFKISHRYFNGGHSKFAYPFMVTSFGSFHMLFLYYNKRGALRETVDYIQENIHYFIEISNGLHSGTANLVEAEYLYETGQYERVQLYATLAYQEAMAKNQLSGAICSLFLMGRLMLMQKNFKEYEHVCQQLMKMHKETDILILQNQIDSALTYLYILNNNYTHAESWLKNGLFEDAYLLPQATITAYIAYGLCLTKEHTSIKLKHVAEIIKEKNKTMPFVLANIYANIFEVICSYETGKLQAALDQLTKTMELCAPDCIISPIVELAFAFEQLIERYPSCTPFERKVVGKAKNHLKQHKKPSITSTVLTRKEIEVLKLYAEGKTAKAIADFKLVSLNTVQTHLKSIYKKLNISSKSEAMMYYHNNFN